MTFFTAELWNQVARATSWALLHSLWQGIIANTVAAAVISVTRKSRPALRYLLLSGVMLLFLVANAVTFGLLLDIEMQSASHTGLPHSGRILFQNQDAVETNTNFDFSFSPIVRFLDEQSLTITIVWVLVFLFKLSQTAGGYQYNRRLIRLAETACDDWQWKIRQLAAQLGLFEQVTLLISSQLQTPSALGFFRQVVIVPAGFLTSLPHAQIEAILLHELAHIRRRDYLVNALQCICENIYFFNPALVWLSALLRRERENCCDDLVVQTTGDEAAYVNALVAFRQMQLESDKTITAFPGPRNQLLQRIKRIISNNNQPLQAMEKVLIAAGVAAVATLSFVSFGDKKQSREPKLNIPPVVTTIDEAPRTAVNAERVVAKNAAQVQRKSDKVTERDTSTFFGNKLAEVNKAAAQNDFDRAQKLKLEASVVLWNEQTALKNRETQLRMQQQAVVKNKDQGAEHSATFTLREAMLKNEAAALEKRRIELAQAQAELDENAGKFWKQFNATHRDEAEKNQEQLIEELIAAGIIKNRENLSYKLHNMFFVVNGVEQPERVHQKFKSMFLKNTWTEYVYNWDGATGYRFTGVRYNG